MISFNCPRSTSLPAKHAKVWFGDENRGAPLSVHCRVPVVLAWLSTLHTSYIVQRDGAAK